MKQLVRMGQTVPLFGRMGFSVAGEVHHQTTAIDRREPLASGPSPLFGPKKDVGGLFRLRTLASAGTSGYTNQTLQSASRAAGVASDLVGT